MNGKYLGRQRRPTYGKTIVNSKCTYILRCVVEGVTTYGENFWTDMGSSRCPKHRHAFRVAWIGTAAVNSSIPWTF